MLEPKTYFLFLQSAFMGSLLVFSIAGDRKVALIVFLGFMIWKLYSRWRLPRAAFSQFSQGRLIHQRLQKGFQNTRHGVNGHKTKLYKLKATWPSVLICYDQGAQLLIQPTLAEKLDDQEISILSAYYNLLSQTNLPYYGTLFYGFFEPWSKAARLIARSLPTRTQHRFSPRPWLLKSLEFFWAPLYAKHDAVFEELCTQHSETAVLTFLSKLYHLRLSHEVAPPLSACFLEIHPKLSLWKHNNLHGPTPFYNAPAKGMFYV